MNYDDRFALFFVGALVGLSIIILVIAAAIVL